MATQILKPVLLVIFIKYGKLLQTLKITHGVVT